MSVAYNSLGFFQMFDGYSEESGILLQETSSTQTGDDNVTSSSFQVLVEFRKKLDDDVSFVDVQYQAKGESYNIER